MRTMTIAGGTKKDEHSFRQVVGYVCLTCRKTYMALGWQPGGPVFQVPVPVAPEKKVEPVEKKVTEQSKLGDAT
jgi:hypothetical protein